MKCCFKIKFLALLLGCIFLVLSCSEKKDTPIEVFSVTAVTNKDYRVESKNITLSKNPVLTLKRGALYIFKVEAYGHPFFIKTEKAKGKKNLFNDGVVNNGIDEGELLFKVPKNAPDTLYYVCQWHDGMAGDIKVVD